MSKNYQVTQIIDYLSEKITSIKSKIGEYEAPIMQEMAKSSPHLQYDFTRLKASQEAHEDILRVIQKFTDGPDNKG